MIATSPLIQLAWAAYTEETLIAVVASNAIAEDLYWSRGHKGNVRSLVKSSCPLRGQKAKRLEAVVAEMRRQRKIADRRAGNVSIDWPMWRPKSRAERLTDLFKSVIGDKCFRGDCKAMRVIRKHRIFLIYDPAASHGSLLVNVAPDGNVTRYIVRSDYHWDVKTIPVAIRDIVTKGDTFCDVLANEARIGIDIVRGVTILTHKDGSVEEVPWEEEP